MEENKNPTKEQEIATTNDNELKNAIEEQLSKIRNQAMVVGFRVSCSTIRDKINVFEKSPGKKSNNDYKRLIKDIKKFVDQALARENTETDSVETVQN